MSNRHATPSSDPPPRPARGSAKGPTRETLLVALAKRERELAEALARQTATSEILRVISQSPTDAQPVFQRIVVTAARLLRCDMAFVLLREGDAYVHTAGATPEGPMADLAPERIPIDPTANFPSRAFLAKTMVHLPDWSQIDLPEHERRIHETFGVNSVLYLPLPRGDECIGLLAFGGRRANMFGPSEIAQAESFRDQALIAMENARLFNETKEALDRQTATAEVLKVISRSAFDLQTVFDTLLGSAVALSGADSGVLAVRDSDAFRCRSFVNKSPDLVRFLSKNPITPGPGSVMGRVALSGRIEWIEDTLADSALSMRNVIRRTNDDRALVGVPLLRDARIEGAIVLGRSEPGRFSARAIELVQIFADQAVIAIENVRLFDEVQAKTRDLEEALQQQTATSDVLKVISRSVLDLDSVLQTLIDTAVRLARGSRGTIFIQKGDVLVASAYHSNVAAALREYLAVTTWRLDGDTHPARAAREGRVVHVPDLSKLEDETTQEVRKRAAYGAGLWVPLIGERQTIGVFGVPRDEPVAFTDREIEIVKTFADQAVIAIENARLFGEVQAKTRDLEEALQQQTATAEVLKVISRSAFDLDAVLNSLTRSAVELCNSTYGVISLYRDGLLKFMAQTGCTPEFAELLWSHPAPLDRKSVTGRTALLRAVVLVPDVTQDEEYDYHGGEITGNYRSCMGVPLLRNGELEGVFTLMRREPGTFTQRQVELVQTFADEAVIAIENVRLFDEVQARTRDLTEALQQQTATADVLKAISRTAFDLDTVLETLISTATRLCDAKYGEIFRRHGDVYRYAASVADLDPAYVRHEQTTEIRPGRGTLIGRVALENRTVEIADAWTDPEYVEKEEARLGNVRAMLGVPLTRDGEPIGAFALARSEPIPFTRRQVELVTTFADQAVIAMENVRLFDEVQARTRDLMEALQMQTATSDVLKVISRSAFDLQAVFNTLVSSAVELGGALTGTICVREGDVFRYRDTIGAEHTSALAQYLRDHPAAPGRATIAGRVLLSGKVERIPDCLADPEYIVPMGSLASNVRSLLGVPLLRKDGVEGAIILTRDEPGHFSDRQVEIVQTFADQAVIALENVRLFDEVQARTRDLMEALQLQTATSEVLKVISRSAFDLQAVFDTLTASAVDLCGAYSGSICVRDGDVYRYRGNAGPGLSVAMSQYLAEHPATPGRGSIVGRVLLLGRVEEIPDVLEDADYVVPLGAHGQVSRALLGVPLLGKDGIEGALVLTRKEPGHFTPRQIEIVQTFADQAVIAIENVRLFDEVQTRTRELSASLDDLRRAQDRLVQSEKLASLGQLTAGIAHEIKNPLNFVNNFSALTRELVDELGETLQRAPLEKGEREEADELIGTIGANLDKVVSHGKRADSIVKNMLLHSREGSGERASVNVNAMVEEALNLAYHGARAEKPGFNVTIARSLDDKAGAAELYAQEMTRVLLNLISNGFYATAKRKQGEGNGSYEPTVTASTRDLGHSVEIAIRDNGTGIPDQVKAKMFNPFFTTKPAGEGTGLGLSLSHDIVVKQHGGTLEVSTEPGSFTQFTIVLPRAGAAG